MGYDFAKNTKPEKNKSQPLLLVAAISLSTRKIERGRGPSQLSAYVKFPIQRKEQEGGQHRRTPASHQPADSTTPFSRLNKR